jgi:hypothetical protein
MKFDPNTLITLSEKEEMIVVVSPFGPDNIMLGYEGKYNKIHISKYFNNVIFAATSVSQFS